jgi:CNT family concentrative nucleoside transporter
VAYASLRDLQGTMSDRSVIIGTYALCGFANFSSIAIQIGGIGGIAPERKSEIAALGLRAVVGGALASWTTATIAGVLVG